jgi:hypothetical protein
MGSKFSKRPPDECSDKPASTTSGVNGCNSSKTPLGSSSPVEEGQEKHSTQSQQLVSARKSSTAAKEHEATFGMCTISPHLDPMCLQEFPSEQDDSWPQIWHIYRFELSTGPNIKGCTKCERYISAIQGFALAYRAEIHPDILKYPFKLSFHGNVPFEAMLVHLDSRLVSDVEALAAQVFHRAILCWEIDVRHDHRKTLSFADCRGCGCDDEFCPKKRPCDATASSSLFDILESNTGGSNSTRNPLSATQWGASADGCWYTLLPLPLPAEAGSNPLWSRAFDTAKPLKREKGVKKSAEENRSLGASILPGDANASSWVRYLQSCAREGASLVAGILDYHAQVGPVNALNTVNALHAPTKPTNTSVSNVEAGQYANAKQSVKKNSARAGEDEEDNDDDNDGDGDEEEKNKGGWGGDGFERDDNFDEKAEEDCRGSTQESSAEMLFQCHSVTNLVGQVVVYGSGIYVGVPDSTQTGGPKKLDDEMKTLPLAREPDPFEVAAGTVRLDSTGRPMEAVSFADHYAQKGKLTRSAIAQLRASGQTSLLACMRLGRSLTHVPLLAPIQRKMVGGRGGNGSGLGFGSGASSDGDNEGDSGGSNMQPGSSHSHLKIDHVLPRHCRTLGPAAYIFIGLLRFQFRTNTLISVCMSLSTPYIDNF